MKRKKENDTGPDEAPDALLDRVNEPADLRALTDSELRQFADELRQETIAAVSCTGGHLGAG
ncbi:MAG: 1-deoxy-D-xylulose-5-phosphate synthase N-terminal domain-containing protein, partial [Alphaproteobacteria bacterium]